VAIRTLADVKAIRAMYLKEKEGWDLYYDVLDALEDGLAGGSKEAESLKARAIKLVRGWRI
jgi:hypothetical protein